MNAEVVMLMGRYFLVVNGIYVAREDDACHDPDMKTKHWTEKSLEHAAKLINHEHYASANDRADRGRHS